MALFSTRNDFPAITSDHYVNRAGQCKSISVSKRKLVHCFEERDGDMPSSPTPIICNVSDTVDYTFLWVTDQQKLFSGAPTNNAPSAQFIITTDPNDPSYIEIQSVAFTDPKIIAADFSNGSQGLIIVSKPLFASKLYIKFIIYRTSPNSTRRIRMRSVTISSVNFIVMARKT